MTKQTVIDRTLGTNKKITQYKRNSRHVVAEMVDPLGWTTTNTHDGLGRRTQESREVDASTDIVTQWAFNANDQVTLLTDDNGNTTAYAFDTAGRLLTKTYDDSTTYTVSYDDAGNITNIVDRAGNDIDLAYSDTNLLTDRDATLATGFEGDTTEDFTYDAMGRLTEAKDNDSIVQFTYDSLSRVETEIQGANPLGTTGKTVTYTRDNEGNATLLEYPAGFEADRTFDAIGRLTSIDDEYAADIADFTMYGAGRRMDTLDFANGTQAEWSWDGFRRPSSIAHTDSGATEFAGFEYGWDKNDNPLYEERSHQSDKGDVYTYDRANRLVTVLQDVDDPANEVANPGTEAYVDKVAYNMDEVLNFTSLVTTPYGGGASTVNYTTNGMNEYTAVGGTTHVYDDNGNLTDDGTNDYVYNWKNQLVEVIDQSGPTTIATYAYDCYGLGRRHEKVVGSDTTRFVYSGQQCIEEYDGSDNLLRTFVFGAGIDEIVMMEAPDVADVDSDANTTELKRFYFHRQLIGSVTHITDPDESVVESYDYGPYGESEIFDQSSSTVSASQIGNPFTYTSRRLDEESGLYYYRARHYSPELNRFIQRDPLEYVDGPSAVAYCLSMPTVAIDPWGLDQVPFSVRPVDIVTSGGGAPVGPKDVTAAGGNATWVGWDYAEQGATVANWRWVVRYTDFDTRRAAVTPGGREECAARSRWTADVDVHLRYELSSITIHVVRLQYIGALSDPEIYHRANVAVLAHESRHKDLMVDAYNRIRSRMSSSSKHRDADRMVVQGSSDGAFLTEGEAMDSAYDDAEADFPPDGVGPQKVESWWSNWFEIPMRNEMAKPNWQYIDFMPVTTLSDEAVPFVSMEKHRGY